MKQVFFYPYAQVCLLISLADVADYLKNGQWESWNFRQRSWSWSVLLSWRQGGVKPQTQRRRRREKKESFWRNILHSRKWFIVGGFWGCWGDAKSGRRTIQHYSFVVQKALIVQWFQWEWWVRVEILEGSYFAVFRGCTCALDTVQCILLNYVALWLRGCISRKILARGLYFWQQ